MKRLLSILLLVVIYNFNSVAQVFNKSGEHFQKQDIKKFAEMASQHDENGNYNEALKYREKEIQATEFIYGTMSEQLLIVLQNTSFMCDKYSDSESAIFYSKCQGAIQATIWGKDNWNYAIYLRLLGKFYSNAQNYEMSIKTFKESINLFESLHTNDNQYALALSFIAQDYYKTGDNRNSLNYHKKCLNVRREIGDAEEYLNELNIILLMSRKTDFVNRFEIINQEISNLPTCVDTSSLVLANIYKEIAHKFWLLNDNISALMYCEKALSITENNAIYKKEDLANILGQKCKYLKLIGRYEDAIKVGERTKQLYESINIRSTLYAELLDNMAWAYRATFDYEKAISFQKKVVKIYEECKDWLSLAESYNSLGHFYNSSEDLSFAEHYLNLALGVLDNHGDAQKIIDEEVERTGNMYINTPSALASVSMRIDYIRVASRQSLARVYIKEEKYTDAINLEKKNVEIFKRLEDTRGYCQHLRILSEYYRGNKKYPEATSCMEECLKFTEVDDKSGLASSYTEFSMIDYEKGNIEDAIKYSEEALSIYKEIDDIEGKNTAQYILSYLYWKNHKTDKAEKVLSELLDSLKYMLTKEMLQMTNEQKQRLWNRYEHNFLMYRNIAESSVRDETLLSKLYDYILFSKSLLLDSNIYKSYNKESMSSISWRDIQKKLSDNDIAIEFVTTIEEDNNGHTYHAMIVDNFSKSPKMITLYSESELRKIKETDAHDINKIVGDLLWKPIIEQYKSVKNIFFSPDGILHALPIEYYEVKNLGRMFEHYNMYRLSSTKELYTENSYLKKYNAVLYGGLDFNLSSENSAEGKSELLSSLAKGLKERGGFEPLSNTLLEIREINNIIKKNGVESTLLFGMDGTEKTFKNLSGHSIDFIHLATHGMYVKSDEIESQKHNHNFDFLETLANDNNPVKEDVMLTHSFLVMSGGNKLINRETDLNSDDGILTAKEISQVNLNGLDLVVLSACESGRGDIEYGGVYGLQRGFKKAGAHTILMSLDKVDDEATRILMVEFYRNLMDGKTKLQSLRNAQKYLRTVENGKYDDPKYWASFIMLDGLN